MRVSSNSSIRKAILKRMQNPTSVDFNDLALEIFRYQYQNVALYREYSTRLNISAEKVKQLSDIPFLPIQFFKSHKIKNSDPTLAIFESSGTTSSSTSRHYISDLDIYHKSIESAFLESYGEIEDYCVLALLPSYLERNNSSLVYMVQHLMKLSDHAKNAFYMHDFKSLNETINELMGRNHKVILFGVSFALIDFVEQFPNQFKDLIIIETGGMKGKRRELIRKELHAILSNGFGSRHIHSEYGMTEMLSMAYSTQSGFFKSPSTQKILIRDLNDPRSYMQNDQSGGINVIDLANLNSCSFIETSDIGKVEESGKFEVLGRHDQSDIRGCSLLYL